MRPVKTSQGDKSQDFSAIHKRKGFNGMHKVKGFAVVELLLILVIVGILGFVAWRVVQQSNVETTVPENTVVENSIPAIQASKDLDTLSDELDTTDIEGSTVVDLESESSF